MLHINTKVPPEIETVRCSRDSRSVVSGKKANHLYELVLLCVHFGQLILLAESEVFFQPCLKSV